MTDAEKLARIKELWSDGVLNIRLVYEIKAPYVLEDYQDVIREMDELLGYDPG